MKNATMTNTTTTTIAATPANIRAFLKARFGADLSDLAIERLLWEMDKEGLFSLDGLSFEPEGEVEDYLSLALLREGLHESIPDDSWNPVFLKPEECWTYFRLSNGDAFSVSPLKVSSWRKPFRSTELSRRYAEEKDAFNTYTYGACGYACVSVAREQRLSLMESALKQHLL